MCSFAALSFWACETQSGASNGISALSAEAPKPPLVTLQGLLQAGGGFFSFRSCDGGKLYSLIDSTAYVSPRYKATCGDIYYKGQSVWAQLRGRIYPSMGGDAGIFAVTQIDTMAQKTKFNTCIPYEFWCLGTEPFWDIQISKAENGIFYNNPLSGQPGLFFPWKKPRTEGEKTIYESQLEDGTKIRIVITPEKCSDGMSDQAFKYSATVTLGETTLRGCAQ